MNILSIQSHVSYGHVGNSAAVFPLQRIGHEVWPVHTVNFSNHTGYGQWGGELIPAAQVRNVIDGMEQRGAFERIDAILSGYQGGSDIADVIVDAVARIKEANPQAVYACDPVMGNAKSGCFVSDLIPPLLRDKVVPVADIITPNQFELEYLTGVPAHDTTSTLEAIAAAQEMGPNTVLVTSVRRPETPADAIEMIAANEQGAWLVRTPFIDFKRNGSGDVTAALFTGHYIRERDAADALARTASSVFDLIETTFTADSRELLIIESQEAIAHPRLQFEVEQIA
ncbi:pyridoxal kinase PdxY [Corynebacterium diphtheriae]|uniref:Pyridoxal kinase PdxY n=2 Tax=Corynebacterium diphtheriae TaxID=1717 RepID=PDXY_CORDI|nr:pyridoxal kinase PdxY [Corynebacterium diphtheriae]Q6NG19.2 RecName: Full=Pyridoxal kinase PdxY; Short=PL kinase [Corynebacterium diphtheriae NCTC 13129]ARB87815.1 pyridoxamine kinase [Corynebacterium diphtheriae]KKA81395.1 pyridoxamine kinase [Corynebacterium diphtheriae]MDZ5308177.1 pyridoxal kinase PdxY [Corynebacterium diphtheriae]OJH97450.1 pyridoxal kinase [Corynebacterium diphtheriae]OSQ03893.1 pyridoxamine kinase [Corynebacterium diphtheriae]